MVVIERLINASHFIAVKSTNSASEVAQIFIKEIVIFHGVLKNIVYDRDAKFTSRFWKNLFVGVGT